MSKRQSCFSKDENSRGISGKATIAKSLIDEEEKGECDLENSKQITAPPVIHSMLRSNSECHLRDKEFYEMCDLDDEIFLYQKLAEQSILDAIHLKNVSDHF